jgi:dTDP-4-amino-4,6-dideoxygalactose transaminase
MHYWLYTVLVDDAASFTAALGARGVEASCVHMRNDLHPALGGAAEPLPGVDSFAAREVAIPVGWWLEDGDCARVIDAVKTWSQDFNGRTRAARPS